MKPLLFAVLGCGLALPAWAMPVTLSVVGPDGKPLSGARIDLRQGEGTAMFGQGETQSFDAPITANAGSFSFDFGGQFIDSKAPIEERIGAKQILWARISAPGMATQTRQLSAPATTIHLTPGRSWSGVVRDQSDKPVEGVRVRLNGWSVREDLSENDAVADVTSSGFNPIDADWANQTTTDAQGRWQLPDLPQSGIARVGLSKAPYARAAFNLSLKYPGAPPLFLRPGASVAGQILTPDGQPLPDQLVVAGWSQDAESQTRTDAQGRFRIDGLTAGQTYLSGQDPRDFFNKDKVIEPRFLLPQQDMVVVRAGETTDIGQWKAQTGTTLKMRVVDAATGKAVEGARFNSFRGGDSFKSDAKGELQARVISEDSRIPSTGTVRADGYISTSVPLLSKAQTGATVDIGAIKLERGSVVKGRARVAGETKPVDLPTLSFQMGGAGDDEYIRLWDGDGSFESSAMKPGIYRVYAYKSWGHEPSKEWEVVSPKTMTVPAPGVEIKPIEVVFKRLKPALPLVKSASGRIVDATGQGVAGAIVVGQFVAGYNSSGALAVTDANGDWSAQSGISANEFKLMGIERPGYVKSGEAKIALAGGVAAVSGVSMKRRGAPFGARVVDANGQAASGAWIAVLEDRYTAPVRADENGEFELPDLALDKFTLLAAKGDDWARVETSASAKNSEIKLAVPAAFERGAAIKTALQGKVEWYRAENYWDILGWERMSEVAARGDDKYGWSGYQFALQLAEREPAIFLQRAPALLEKVGAGYKEEVVAKWRQVQGASGDADARIAANNWVDEQKAEKKAINAASVMQLLRAAAVARALKRADADDLNDYAAAIAAQTNGASEDEANFLGKMLGQSGYAATQRFADGLKPILEFEVWNAATPRIARSGDVAGTKAALTRMEVLAVTPAWVEKARKEHWNNPVNKIEYTRVEAARALSATDIAAAVALIENLDDSDYSKGRAARTIADRAIEAGDLKTAEKLLRGAMQSRISNAEGFALAASLAQRVSPQFGAEMWADALRRAIPARPDSDYGRSYEPSVAMWAFYHARLDAAQSRALIEREWNWRLPAAVKINDTDEFGEEASFLRRLAMAMAAVDPARALELRAQFVKATGKPADANFGLAATLLADEATRARLGVDDRY